ncbi:MAG: hypothetical protein JAZ19_09820 [Candidatus Thiodiazotropha taylori]|nr:hypothetical protein [Candidatus Thiodiazotropha taylori]
MTAPDKLKPWATRPFELITHGEVHFRRGSDYDRRLALVSFDNAVEVTITTYLTLKPIQRDGKSYNKDDVSKWLNNYHTKLDFFLKENSDRGLPEHQSKDVIVWYHDQRNEQYHGGSSGVPEQSTLDGLRQSALWVFSVLFETTNVEEVLEVEIAKKAVGAPQIPPGLTVPASPAVTEGESTAMQSNALAAASLLGQWQEGKEADQEIARRLVDEF